MRFYTPFCVKDADLSFSIHPWTARFWVEKKKSTVTFSVNEEDGTSIMLNDIQIATIWTLLTEFWFKIDEIVRSWDSEFNKIILNPTDQIEFIEIKNTEKKRKKPIHVIQVQWETQDNHSFVKQAMDKLVVEWNLNIIQDIVYNWEGEKYIQFCKWLVASIEHVLKQSD